MIVTINEKYKVDIDEFNHTLEQYDEGGNLMVNGKYKGDLTKPSWKVIGYFPNMSQVLREVVRIEARNGGDTDLEGYLQRLEKLNEEIKV